ncbi:MAG TPA: response regulator [Verrucomicrobiae bacterium]|nr:response regulator [Verrucomicrobiae bacterium]
MARALQVLLVEDNDDDATLIGLAFQSIGGGHKVCSVSGAEDAIQLLQEKDRRQLPLPDLVLIDLRMPRLSGLDFLAWLQRHPRLSALPAVVLSGSSIDCEIKEAYQLGARSVLVKPAGFNELKNGLSAFISFWSMCRFPSGVPAPADGLPHPLS